MMKAMTFATGVLFGLAYCSAPLLPMQDGENALDKIKEEVQKELGEKFQVTTLLDLYVVASDDPVALKRGMGTVERVYKAMYKEFMKTRPTEPLKVYLFKDKASYEAYNKQAYGREPTTPYGFYMPSERKMVMNIATGLGTLAHEMVHPLNEADFPSIPSWFNEGFASLFEQSYYTDDGGIRGDVNWRLPALQKAIAAGDAPALKEVMKTRRDEFYGKGSGLNYATGRYLCYYLQENGLLVKYYQGFRDNAKEDPSGIETLEKLIGESVDEFEPKFRKFVSRLSYR
jgi:hypothetical protein